MNYGLTLIVSFFSFVQASFREFREGGFGHVHLGYVRLSQKLVGILGYEETLPWARWCNKLHSTMHCPSERVCFPERVATTVLDVK